MYCVVFGQIDVESFDAGKPIDLRILDGTWRLQYTSAPDVLILLQSAATLPFFEVQGIGIIFSCQQYFGSTLLQLLQCEYLLS